MPKPDALSLRDIKFIIITPENAAEVFAKLKDDKVLFALTTKGYEDTALNLSDIKAYIRQQNRVIILYKDSFKE